MNWSYLFDGRNLRSNTWSTKYIIKPQADSSVAPGSMSLCCLTTNDEKQNIVNDATGLGRCCRPVLKQDEDICDFLFDHGSYTGNIDSAVTRMIHGEVHAMIVMETPSSHEDYIKKIASLIVEHCIRRYWCERPDDATCDNIYQDLTRSSIMNCWACMPFKAAYEGLIKEYHNLSAHLHAEYQEIALNDYRLGVVRLPLDPRIHDRFDLHLRPTCWEKE
jgi:hypothetical protein